MTICSARVGAALREAAAMLAAAGLEAPRREARLLAAHVLGVAPGVLLDEEAEIDRVAFGAVVARRAAREPLALITGRRGFWTLDMAVSRDTLIPRPDSETLIEAALASLPDRAAVRRVLDLGTGTGCLLLAALTEFPQAFGVGVDVAPASVALAARNARAAGLAARCAFHAGHWAEAVAGRFDLIMCNPPYIPSGDLAGLMPEVRVHEPARALDGGASGLVAYRAVLPGLPALLAPGGIAVLELGVRQAPAVTALARALGLGVMTVRHDLGGVARALVLCPPP